MQPRTSAQATEDVYTLARARACAIAKAIATQSVFMGIEVAQVELWIDAVFEDLRNEFEIGRASKHDTDIVLAFMRREFIKEASHLVILMHLDGGTA